MAKTSTVLSVSAEANLLVDLLNKYKYSLQVVKLIAASSEHQIYLCEKDGKKSKRCAVKFFLRKGLVSRSVVRELFVWKYLERFQPFERLFPPTEKICPSIAIFPLLGPSLKQLKTQFGEFSLEGTLRLGIEMLAAIRELHELGIVHRNITPSHFCLHPQNPPGHLFGKLVLIDLSNAYPYCISEPNANYIPNNRPMANKLFKTVHQGPYYKPGMNDDLISWIFVMIFLRTDRASTVPWDTKQLKQDKLDYWRVLPKMLFFFGPNVGLALVQIVMHIKSLDNAQSPRYAGIYKILRITLKKVNNGNNLLHYAKEETTLAFKPEIEEIKKPMKWEYYLQEIPGVIDCNVVIALFKKAFYSKKAVAQYEAAEQGALKARQAYKNFYGGQCEIIGYQVQVREMGLKPCTEADLREEEKAKESVMKEAGKEFETPSPVRSKMISPTIEVPKQRTVSKKKPRGPGITEKRRKPGQVDITRTSKKHNNNDKNKIQPEPVTPPLTVSPARTKKEDVPAPKNLITSKYAGLTAPPAPPKNTVVPKSPLEKTAEDEEAVKKSGSGPKSKSSGQTSDQAKSEI